MSRSGDAGGGGGSSNPFGRFLHTSKLSSVHHDPLLSLASNCIRDYFGPVVQLVADALALRGEYSTLSQVVQIIYNKCHLKIWSEERLRLMGDDQRKGQKLAAVASYRAALLVLTQHSLVDIQAQRQSSKQRNTTLYSYRLNLDRCRLIPRYPRYVEYARKALDDTAASLVEELLVQGRMKTIDAIQKTIEHIKLKQKQQEDKEDENEKTLDEEEEAEKYQLQLKAVVESFHRLVGGGFLQPVSKILQVSDDPDEGEMEFEAGEGPPKKKVKISLPEEDVPECARDPIEEILQKHPFRETLPTDTVWRVNLHMFHDSLRAFCLGRLVAERYGHKVQSAGSMVTAALKYVAYLQHTQYLRDHSGGNSDKGDNQNTNTASSNLDDLTCFDAASVVRYIPKPVQQLLEKKTGGIIPNLAKSLHDLCQFKSPMVIAEVETGGKPEHSKFEVATRRLVQYLQRRIIHQVVLDAHGEVAARVISILTLNGHLESDSIAEAAMVPAKDTREILHQLYRAKFIDLFTLSPTRVHNPATMIYLWTLNPLRILRNVRGKICTAIFNMRLRRQHEVEVGKTWIERAQEAGEMDENDHETDKQNYQKFCLGLERLDSSTLQLDETLMVLKDF